MEEWRFEKEGEEGRNGCVGEVEPNEDAGFGYGWVISTKGV